MDSTAQIFGEGVSPNHATWTLGWESDDLDDPRGITWLRVTTSDGHTHKGGYGDASLYADDPVSVYSGGADHVPNGAILRVRSDTLSLEVTTSDGVIQRLDLLEHPAHEGASVAVLIYPRGTRITSMLLVDHSGPRTVPMTRPQV